MSSAVAVIGLGAMGSRIAGRLLAAGREVVVWNRTAERASGLVGAGARSAGTPAAAAAASGVVITMVADRAAVEAVAAGADGLLAGLRPGSVWIDMSTVGRSAVHTIAAALPPEVDFVDAPVLGSVAEAEAGELAIFTAGTERGLERARPVLGTLGTVVPVGPPGSGAAAKLVANAALLGCIALLGETLALSRALGLPDETAFEVLSTTPLAAQAAKRRPAIGTDEFPARFRLRLAAKDAGLVLDEAGDRAELPMLNAVAAWLRGADEAGDGDLDYTAVLRRILAAGTAFPAG